MRDSFDCSLTRETLWPDPAEAPQTETAQRARSHLASCSSCAAFFRNDGELASRLSGLASLRAPDSLRVRVAELLDTNPGAATSRTVKLFRPKIAAPVTVLAMAAALTLLIARGQAPQPAPIVTAVAAAHIWDNSTTRTEETSPAALDRWFAKHFEHKMSVPDIPDGRVLGASVGMFEGHKSASVSYDVRGTRLAYMVVPASFVMNRSISAGDGPYYISTAGDNENAVLWGWDETARILTGDLPPDELMRIAERCRHAEQNEI